MKIFQSFILIATTCFLTINSSYGSLGNGCEILQTNGINKIFDIEAVSDFTSHGTKNFMLKLSPAITIHGEIVKIGQPRWDRSITGIMKMKAIRFMNADQVQSNVTNIVQGITPDEGTCTLEFSYISKEKIKRNTLFPKISFYIQDVKVTYTIKDQTNMKDSMSKEKTTKKLGDAILGLH